MAKKQHGGAKGGGCVYLPHANGKILSRIYRARWVVDGKVYTQTTGESDKRKAEKVLAQLVHPFQAETQEERESQMLAKVQGTRAEIQAWKDAQPALGLQMAFAAYRKNTSRPNKSNADTLDRYESQYLEFAKWIAVRFPDVQELRQVTKEMADLFANELKETRSANTFNKRITLYRSIWKNLKESARLTANPWESIRKMELDTHTRRELTVDELRRVCTSLSGEMQVLFAIGIYTGLRLSDACLLDWGRVDFATGLITIVPHKTKKHANGKNTLIPIHPVLGEMLSRTPPAERVGYVLPEIAQTLEHDPTIISRQIQQIFEDNGIKTHSDQKSISGRAQVDIGFHSLRHTFVSLSANAGVPLAIVQAIVSHSNPAMTRHYLHESVPALKSAVAALPSIPMTNGTNATQDTPTIAPAAEATTTPEEGADAAEGRFRAFCAIVEKMDGDELRKAQEWIAHYHAE